MAAVAVSVSVQVLRGPSTEIHPQRTPPISLLISAVYIQTKVDSISPCPKLVKYF
jgi:hypothetical protein